MQKPMQPSLLAHVRARAQEVGGALEVAEHGRVGHREQPREQRLHVARGRRAAFARVEVDAQRHVADVGEAVDDVADVLAEPTGLVDHDHPCRGRAARALAGAGVGEVAVHRRAAGAGEGEVLGERRDSDR